MQRRLRLALIATVLIVGLILGIGLLHSPWTKNYLFRRLEQYLATSQGLTLQLEELDYSLLRFSVSVSGLSLQAAAASDPTPFLTIDQMRLDFSLWSLLQGLPRIEEAQLEGTTIQLLINERGDSNLPQSGSRSGAGEQSPTLPLFPIESLSSTGGYFFLQDQRRQFSLELPHWRLAMTGDGASLEHEMELVSLQAGTLEWSGMTLPLDRVDLSADLSPPVLAFSEASIHSGGSSLQFKGTLVNFADPRLDLQVPARLDAEDWKRLTGVSYPTSGNLDLEIDITGSLTTPQIAGRLRGEDLLIGVLGQVQIDANMSWRVGEDEVFIQSARLNSSLGEAEGRGSLALHASQESSPSRVDIELDQLDLRQLSRMANWGVELASLASGTIQATWPGPLPQQAEIQGNLQLQQTRRQAASSLLPLSGELAFEAGPERVQISVGRLTGLGLEVGGQMSLNPPGLTELLSLELAGRLRGKVQQLSRLTLQLQRFLGRPQENPLIPFETAGGLEFTLSLGGTVGQPRFQSRISAPALRIASFEEIAFDLEAEYDLETLFFQDALLHWKNHHLVAQGAIGLGESDPTLRLEARLEPGSLTEILAVFGREFPAEGTIGMSASLGGTWAQPRGEVEINGSDLVLYHEPMGSLRAEAEWEDSTLGIRQLHLSKPSPEGEGILSAQGSYSSDSGTFAFGAEGRNLRLTRLVLPGELPIRGLFNFSSSGRGDLLAPVIDLQMDADRLEVRGQALGSMQATVVQSLPSQTGLQLNFPEYGLLLQAKGQSRAPYPLAFELKAESANLAAFPLRLPEGFTLEGTLSGSLSGEGELEHWRRSQVQISVSDLQLLLNDHPIRNRSPITGSLSEDFLEVKTGILQLDQTQLQIAGRIPLRSSEAPGFLEASADADLGNLLNLFPIRPQLAAEGKLSARGTLRGSLEQFEPSLHLSVTDGSLQDSSLPAPISDVELDLLLENGSLALSQLEGQLGDGRFEIQGEIPLGFLPMELPSPIERRDGPIKVNMRLNDLQLESLGVLPESIGGALSVRVEAQASRADLGNISGQADFDQLKLRLGNQLFEQQEPSRFSMKSGVMRIDRLSLIGSDLRIRGSGTVDLVADRNLDLLLEGDVDMGALAAFVDGLEAAGNTTLRLAVRGQPGKPQISGVLEVRGGDIQLPFQGLQAQDLSMRLQLDENRITIEQLVGELNGGTFEASGHLRYAAGSLRDLQVDLGAEELFLNLPQGLRSISRAELTLRSQDEAIILGGRVDLVEGTYREPFYLEGGLLQYLRSEQSFQPEERSGLLARLVFDVTVNTVNPVVVDNNLAKLLLAGNVRLAGNYYRPALIGRITLEQGGEFYFHEKTFVVERGTVSFFDETRIRPELDVLATTQTRGYQIALQLSGEAEDLQTNLSSDPPLTQTDIVAVLLTGRTLESLRGAEVNVATEQAFSYLAGRGSNLLGEAAERTLGLSWVRIEPNLISPESTPGARLTVGQDLTSRLRFVYSMNLVDSRDQIHIGEYDISRRFTTRGVRQSDNTYRFEFGHELRFGQPPPQSQVGQSIFGSPRRIGEISFSGNPPFSHAELEGRLKLRPGQPYDVFKIQTGVERLNSLFEKEDLLEARLRLNRVSRDTQMDLQFAIESGPRVEIVFAGSPISGSLKKQVREVWTAGISEDQRVRDAIATIRISLLKKGYWQAQVSHSVSYLSQNQKQITFLVEPGMKYQEVALVFEGIAAIESSGLEKGIREARLMDYLGTEPNRVTEFLTRFYRQAGYLDARVEHPRYLFDPNKGQVQVVISVREGAAFRVGRLEFSGSQVFEEAILLETISLKPGEVYGRTPAEESRRRLEELYWRRGHNDVRITQSAQRLADQPLVDVVFEIEEGRQEVVREIHVSGNLRSSDNFVRRQLLFDVGEVLDLDKVSRSRKNLYDSGAFESVEIGSEEITTLAPEDVSRRPMRLLVNLREVPLFSLHYGAFYDTDRSFGVIADLTNRNFWGGARLLGVRGRYDSDVRELRGYFSQPVLPRMPFKTNIGAFVRRELREAFITDLIGFSIEQETRVRNEFVVSFGYRFERNKTFDRDPDSLFVVPPFHVASLTATVGRDTRDYLLDATRGSFTSHALQYAPSVLGSDVQFIKYLGQYFKYFPLSQSSEVPYSGGLKRTRLVFASGLRVGLARGLGGQIIIPNERFFAGGGTTIRGFAQDEVGPKDEFFGDPVGGDALFILNNELRFPIFNILDGVSFLDLGNVYPSINDFDPLDVRVSAGLGLRIRAPYFLLRFDYGWKLDRKPGESAGELFFSIGQAF